MFNGLDVIKLNDTDVLGLNTIGCSGSRSRTTDMEGTHSQLCARLADRLSGNNADCLTDIDAIASRQVTAVALRAHTVSNFAVDR